MMLVPEHLQKGDTIAISCPSGYMHEETIQNAIRAFEEWGLKVITGQTLSYPSDNYFSAPDELKLHELQAFLDDPNIKAVFMGRGGYGMSRIIDRLDFSSFLRQPKWICGFSDITLLHLHIQSLGVVSLHSPMCAAFNQTDQHIYDKNTRYLQDALMHTCLMDYSYETDCSYTRNGTAEGRLIGGNLAMLSHAVGSPSLPDMTDAILFIEDIGEHIYKVDRMLYQLKRAGVFAKIRGVIAGQFSDMEDTARPFGQALEEVIHNHFKDMAIPVAYHFPAGHEDVNLAFKAGQTHILEINYPVIKLTESIY